MIEYEIPFVCLIFTTMISIVFFSKRKVELEENYYYKNVLIFTLLVNISNFISHYGASIYLVDTVDNWYANVFSLINKIGSWFIVIITFNVMSYVLYISFKKYREKFKIYKMVNNIMYLITGILILSLDFTVIKEGAITSGEGSSVILTFALVFINLISAIIVALINVKKCDKRYLSIYIIIPLIIGLGLFVMFHPQFNIYDLILTLLCYLMYFTIENPDVKMIEELELAKNQAEKANHAKTDFLSSMSHEIRTPLNAIVCFSECVLSSNTLEEAKENSADIINASKTLLEIVNGILDISKIESGKLEINNSSYKAKELLENVATLVRPRMEEKGLDFQISISEDIPEVLYGDHSNLKKIITNLLSNASKYTEHGFVKYSVSCINNNNICRLIITVEDSGRGIKEENISKLFTKFQRLDEDRNTTIEGTGLGLAITKKLLELMGGKIVVQSRYGEGSKFTAIVDQKIEIIKNLNIAPIEVITKSKDVSGKKVLIVDDNTLNLKVASKLLEKYKLNIETVDSGLACIEKINSGSIYDMILMDDMMPKMSGVETLNELKKQSNFTTPVIALTANAISGMKEKYISCGFNDYLAKPINKTELETIVYKYLNTTGSTKTNINFGELPKEVYQIGSKGGLIVPDNPDNKENSNNSSITVDVSNDKEQILKDNDIDYQKGIELLGDISMYQETMKDFLNGINERISNLEKYQNDMNSYAIEVHALKSDSKYLGFTKLAEIAYDQELRSKENNQRYIISNYSQLKEEVSRVCDVCKKYLSTI